MAETQDDIEVTEDGGGKSKLKLIIIAVVVLALIGGGAMIFLGGDDPATEEAESETTDTTAAPTTKQPPIYFALDKALVVNFSDQSNGTVRYLQLKVEVMARDQAIIDAFKLHLPAIKHALLLLLLSQKYDAIKVPEGGEFLQEQVTTIINDILTSNESDKLEAVYTDLLMQ